MQFPIFQVLSDQGAHPPVIFDRSVCVIGRDYDANLPLEAPQVSRHHALVVRDNAGVYLRDLCSLNGTQVNGQAVLEAVLTDGDEVVVGPFTLHCHSGFAPAGNSNGDGDGQPDGATAPAAAEESPPADLRLGGRIHPFPAGQRALVIGRRKQCDLVIDDPSVAPVHAVIFLLGGKHYVRDLNTHGKTRLNDERVHRSELRNGDLLKIGDVTVEYRYDAEPQAAVAAPRTAEFDVPAPAEAGFDADDSAAPIALSLEEFSADGEPVQASAEEDSMVGVAAASVDRAQSEPQVDPELAAIDQLSAEGLGALDDSAMPAANAAEDFNADSRIPLVGASSRNAPQPGRAAASDRWNKKPAADHEADDEGLIPLVADEDDRGDVPGQSAHRSSKWKTEPANKAAQRGSKRT